MPNANENETDSLIEQALRLGDLRKEVMDRTDGPVFEWNTRILACEYGTTEDPEGTQTWLRYYADDATREAWDDEVPPKETPPYNRDRFLPDAPEDG